jgi:ATP-dependent Zn protease
MKTSRWNSLSVIAILLALVFLYSFWQGTEKVDEISFSDFLSYIQPETGFSQVASVELREDEGIILGERYVPQGVGTVAQGTVTTKFRTRFPFQYEEQIVNRLVDHGVKIEVKAPPLFLQALSPLLLLVIPLALFALLYFFLYRQAQASGRRSVSASRVRR